MIVPFRYATRSAIVNGLDRAHVALATNTLREPAYYEYAATIETPPDLDHLKQNNTVVSYLFVEGEGKVLLVTSPEADDREWRSLAKTLRDADRLVEQISSYDLPRDVLEDVYWRNAARLFGLSAPPGRSTP